MGRLDAERAGGERTEIADFQGRLDFQDAWEKVSPFRNVSVRSLS
jgi:hypothetical protein